MVNIYKLEIVDFNKEKQTVDLHIECSKGTYIRSIANDLGEALGCYGHLIKLVRIKAGKFGINEAIRLDTLETKEQVEKNLIYPLEFLDYPKYELNDSEREKVSHGMGINVGLEDGIAVLISHDELIAVANVENKKAKISKVFI